MQEKHNCIANALELRLSCTKPLRCGFNVVSTEHSVIHTGRINIELDLRSLRIAQRHDLMDHAYLLRTQLYMLLEV